jgi:hypothetical protein
MKKFLLLLVLLSLACRTSALTQTTAEARPAPTAIRARVQVLVSPTALNVGHVVAVESLTVRESDDLRSKALNYLYHLDPVVELECSNVDDLVWVRHSLGWSVARNATTEYIDGVCE